VLHYLISRLQILDDDGDLDILITGSKCTPTTLLQGYIQNDGNGNYTMAVGLHNRCLSDFADIDMITI
jgi:hypothetical protein